MHIIPKYLFWLALVFAFTASHAAELRSPAEMTPDDWNYISEAKDKYYSCLQEKMNEFGKTSDDPRVISDKVLDVCSTILITLDSDLAGRNINPDFSRRYIYNLKNKAGQQLLRNLMMMIASRQQE